MGTGSKTKEQEHDWYKVGFLKKIEQGWTGNRNKARLVCKGYTHIEGIYF
jgi:hypothetical protein